MLTDVSIIIGTSIQLYVMSVVFKKLILDSFKTEEEFYVLCTSSDKAN